LIRLLFDDFDSDACGFGAGLANLILGEKLQTFHITALVLAVAGIWLAERRAGKRSSLP
jgi:drug/metabolite transporter (DMT)-like permease